ncbi:LTA synthase family protein [Streptococcus suis]|uniref:LTA synthase family protein n=1 Tax=Streptococcus suis TaxID=1307 RepID=UPI0037565FBE
MMNKLKDLLVLKNYEHFLQSIPYSKFAYYTSVIVAIFLLIFIGSIIPVQSLLASQEAFSAQLPFWWGLSGIIILYFASLLSRVLNLKNFLRFILAYFFILIISYGIFLGININNPTIDMWDFSGNGFFQLKVIRTIFSILLLAYVVRFSPRLNALIQKYIICLNETFLISTILVYCILNNSLFIDFFNQQIGNSLSFGIFEFFNEVENILFLPFILAWCGSIVTYKAVCDFWENRSSIWTATFTSVFLAVIFNFTLQLGIKGEEKLLDRYIFQGAVSYQILLLSIIFLLTYVVVNRYISSTFLIVFVFSIISTVNAVKETMRNEPLLISDFTWITELSTVAGFVDGNIIGKIIQYSVLLVSITIALHFTILKGKVIGYWKKRLALVVSLLGILGMIFNIFSNSDQGKIKENIPIISNLNNKDDIAWFGFTTNARYKSLMYVWTKQLTKQIMIKPEAYSKEKIEEIVNKYSKLASEINQSRTSSIEEQTLIFVLSESFSNPAHVPNVQVSKNVIPNIEEIMSQTTSGIMKSDAYGGGTANMEFQSLSGLPFYNFSSSVSLAYIEVVPKLNYFPSISNYFAPEDRIVIHPASAKNYNRNNIYKDLAFSKFIAQSDTDFPISNPVAVGALIGDQTVYSNVLDNIQQDKSQFFSVITMQNHSPWIASEPSEILATGVGFTTEENEKLTSYSRLLSYTDEATREFLNRLSELDKKVTLVFYGDHLPGLYPQATFKEKPESQFQTDYFIWSNKDTQKLNYPYLNSSDFTAALFEHTNSKVSPYVALLTEVLNKASIDKIDLTEEGKTVADDLYLLQYDITVGKGYIQDYLSFFEIN